MSYDPNQPQPPYGQPPQQPPYGGQPQPPYGQQPPPPYEQGQAQYGVPPVPGVVPPQQPVKKKHTVRNIIIGVIVAIVLLGGGCAALIGIGANAIQNSPAVTVTKAYYDAVKGQDYAKAFTYFDPNIPLTTSSGTQKLDEPIFTQVAQAADAANGNVTAYMVTNTSLSTNNGVNTADVTVSVTRNATKDVHVKLMQQGTDWKIVSIDSI